MRAVWLRNEWPIVTHWQVILGVYADDLEAFTLLNNSPLSQINLL